MQKYSISFAILFLSTLMLNAQSTMIAFNPDCMQEFTYQVNQESNGNFYVGSDKQYMLETERGDKVYLKIAQTPQSSLTEMPPNALACTALSVDEIMVKKINDRTSAYYLLIPDGKFIYNYPIVEATYLFSNANKISFTSKDIAFDYVMNSDSKKNLAKNGSKAKVYLTSTNSAVCPSQFTFEAKTKNKDRKFQTLTLTPGLGVFKYNVAKKKKELAYNGEELVTVDGFNMDRYMDAVCNNYVDILRQEKAGNAVAENDKKMNKDKSKEKADEVTTSEAQKNPYQQNNNSDFLNNSDEIATYDYDKSSVVTYSTTPKQRQYSDGRIISSTDENSSRVSTSGKNSKVKVYSNTQPSQTTTTYSSDVVRNQPSQVITSNSSIVEGTYTQVSKCGHIYKDLNKNVFFDKNTGKLANVECGGITYRNGFAITRNSNIASTNTSSTVVSNTTSRPATVVNNYDYSDYSTSDRDMGTHTYGEPAVHSAPTTYSTTISSDGCPEDSSEGVHVVQKGETLYRIASYYNISINDLKKLNGLENNSIRRCQRLVYNGNATNTNNSSYAVATSVSSTNEVHVVAKGETLYRISKKYGVSVSDLKEMNGILDNNIHVGQKLVLGNGYTESFTAKGTSYIEPVNRASSNTKIHVVKKGETLYRISKMYNTPISTIKELNELESNVISNGQTLLVE